VTNITIEDLKSFRGLSAELAALQEERQWLYYPVSSPTGKDEGHGTMPSDPTAQAVRKLREMDARILRKQTEIADRLSEILTWLDSVEDTEVRAMIHWYYLMNLDWAKTCLKVYGYRSNQACRKRVMRYFGYEK